MSGKKERTLVILKPEVLARRLTGIILFYFDNHEFDLKDIKIHTPTRAEITEHYKSVFQRLPDDTCEGIITRMTRGPCVFALYEGVDIIQKIRNIVGDTDPKKAGPHTLRSIYGTDIGHNVIHASDSSLSAEEEIGLWFPQYSK